MVQPERRRRSRALLARRLTHHHWTLEGTNTGPGGTGHHVRISGFEVWKLDANGLIAESRGQFDEASFNHQLKHGFDVTPK